MVNRTSSNVVIDSPETVAALEYAMQLYANFIEGTAASQSSAPSNNIQAFLFGSRSARGGNGIFDPPVRRNSPDPALRTIKTPI